MKCNDDGFPPIEVFVRSDNNNESHQLYNSIVEKNLKKSLPKDFLDTLPGRDKNQESIMPHLEELLPLITLSEFKTPPFNLSFYLVCPSRVNAFKFFFEMISRWLIPGKRLDALLFFAVDFCFLGRRDKTFTICELVINVESKKDLILIEKNLPLFETEVRLGVSSVQHAQRILDIKGLSGDEKTSMIQELVLTLINHRPQYFDHDLLTEMQHFLVVARDSFKAIREARHMSRIICTHYIFRKNLLRSVEVQPEKRHISIKSIKTRLHQKEGLKTVLGFVIGINFLRDNELLEERHIIKALNNYVPNILAIEDSFFSVHSRNDSIRTIYLEIEKASGEDFSPEEVQILRKELPIDLKNRIEHLMHPIFMPHNEEEVMRNILTLSNQLKYLRDIPQVMISFDQQSDSHLSFTVILLRILKDEQLSIPEAFKQSDSFFEYIHDRSKVVGYIRKKHAKEANVFRVRLDKTPFLRADHSLDLYKGRQTVVSELMRVVGDIRDYNGGMISKQNELFCALKDSLTGAGKQNEFLLENFFYSLTPVVMRTILEPLPLKKLFLMLLDAMEEGFFKGESYEYKVQNDGDFLFVMITADDSSFKDIVETSIESLEISSLNLASTFVDVYDTPCLGYLYRLEGPGVGEAFEMTVKQSLELWEQKTYGSAPKQQLEFALT
jgi:hypothetical protein